MAMNVRPHFLWFPFGLFAIFLVSRVVMMYAIKDMPVDTVTTSSYQASLTFNQDRDAMQRFNQAGLALRHSRQEMFIEPQAHDKVLAELSALRVICRHPAHAALDTEFAWTIRSNRLT